MLLLKVLGCALVRATVWPIAKMLFTNPRKLGYELGFCHDPDSLNKTEPEDRKRYKLLCGKVLRRARFRCERYGARRELKVYYIVDPRKGGRCTYNNLLGVFYWLFISFSLLLGLRYQKN